MAILGAAALEALWNVMTLKMGIAEEEATSLIKVCKSWKVPSDQGLPSVGESELTPIWWNAGAILRNSMCVA